MLNRKKRNTGRRGALPGGALCFGLLWIVLLAGGVAWGAVVKAPPPPPLNEVRPNPNTAGRSVLKVSSNPPGATLYLGGRLLGVTPWSGATLPTGRFPLLLLLQSHAQVEDEVVLSPSQAVEKSYILVPNRGGLDVVTTPQGARVILDGQEQEGKTPRYFTELTLGPHQVKVHLDRYYDSELSVVVKPDDVARADFNLTGGQLVACGNLWLEPEAAAKCLVEMDERKKASAMGAFVEVPGGCFQMGDNLSGILDEAPVHEVCLDPFAIGKFEVTQEQWLGVMGKNPSYFKKGGNFPVERVTWIEAQDFISRLNVMTGKNFRLPSEAEWEYAARSGGKQELYAGGEVLNDFAWYDANSGVSTHAVGSKQPNGLGIYDMSGNVAEWVQDWYESEFYKHSPRKNPVGPLGVWSGRIYRGGGWNTGPGLARCSKRDRYEPTNDFAAIGFRLAYSTR